MRGDQPSACQARKGSGWCREVDVNSRDTAPVLMGGAIRVRGTHDRQGFMGA